MIRIPGMLIVGAAGRKAGKTEFACSLIRKFRARSPIVGLKVTTIRDEHGTCPRGGQGCGVCFSLEGKYAITEETDRSSGKDTARLLAAGAERVFWLRVLAAHLEEGVTALIKRIGDNAVSICESNSLRLTCEPDLFLMVKECKSQQFKTSALQVKDRADRIVEFDGQSFDLDLDKIELLDGRWSIREEASAIILAGGRNVRMGRDKSMLPIGGRPMIEHIYWQLRPNFAQILISSSANDADKYAFLDAEVIADKEPGLGPLMGIASTVEASANDLNLVVACDIPQIDIPFVRRMIRQAGGYDAVVPVTGEDRFEPLLAVYRKSLVKAMLEVLGSGRRKIIDAFELGKIRYIDLPGGQWLKNLNTIEDYERYRSTIE